MRKRIRSPLSDAYIDAAMGWVEAEATASLLEDMKPSVMALQIEAMDDLPMNRAEQKVRASKTWAQLLNKISKARRAANVRKVQMEYAKMRMAELRGEKP